MSASSMLQTMADDSAGQQRPSRLSFFLNAEVKSAGGFSGTVRVRNLSSGGMKAEGAHLLKKGDIVTVTLRNIGAVPGLVAWSEVGTFGVQFQDPIDPAQVQKSPPREGPELWHPYLR